MKIRICKNGEPGWHDVDAISPEEAIKTYYGVRVTLVSERLDGFQVFEDVRDDVNQSYGVVPIQQKVD